MKILVIAAHPDDEDEFFVEPDGWRILDSNPFHKTPVSNCLAIYRKHKPQFDMIRVYEF